jgi:hypothetical protein
MDITKEQRESARNRRLLWPQTARRVENVFEFPLDYGLRNLVLDWIAVYTQGDYYIGANVLYFVEDQDAMAYRLYDVRNKCEELNKA